MVIEMARSPGRLVARALRHLPRCPQLVSKSVTIVAREALSATRLLVWRSRRRRIAARLQFLRCLF